METILKSYNQYGDIAIGAVELIRHGPCRSWFHTATFIMEIGEYRNGERIGEYVSAL